MNRILAVVTPTEESVELLEEAGQIAAGTDVEIVVLALEIDDSDHTSADAMRSWEGFDDADSETQTDTALRFADYFGEQVLDPLGASYLPIGGRVENTRPSTKVIDTAQNHGCDHVFITNRKRSPAGKALFGDTAQSIILSFDGYVTVRTV